MLWSYCQWLHLIRIIRVTGATAAHAAVGSGPPSQRCRSRSGWNSRAFVSHWLAVPASNAPLRRYDNATLASAVSGGRIFAQALVAVHIARCDEPAVDGQANQRPAQRILDSDPEISAVMKHWNITEPVTDPKKRAELKKLYTLIPKQVSELRFLGGPPGGAPPKQPLPPEGSLETRLGLSQPENVEQHKASVILLKQPEPRERLAHYAVIFADNYFLRRLLLRM